MDDPATKSGTDQKQLDEKLLESGKKKDKSKKEILS